MLELKLARSEDAICISRMSAALIEYGLPKSWSAARVAHHILRKDSVALIAKEKEQTLGFAVMEFGEDFAHLNLLAVSTLARRRGIGRRMLEWLHKSAVTAGTFKVHLELRASNHVALRFYTAMGYCQTDYQERYYWRTEDAIVMTRNLAMNSTHWSSLSLPSKFMVNGI